MGFVRTITILVQMLIPPEVGDKLASEAAKNKSVGHEEPSARQKRQIPITSSLDYRSNGWVTPVKNQGTDRITSNDKKSTSIFRRMRLLLGVCGDRRL